MNSTLRSLLFWMVLVVVGVLIWQFSTAFAGKTEAPLPFSAFLKYVDDNLNGTSAEVPGIGSEENAAMKKQIAALQQHLETVQGELRSLKQSLGA